MLTSQRKQLILQRLQKDGQIVAKQFSQELGLSEDTIRRDLRELAQEGHLQRVHGGALPASAALADFPGRERLSTASKTAIGKVAAAMVRPGQVVFLDGGTTTRELARHLARDLQATVVTHSPTIAVELAGHPGIEVILLGGRLFKHSVVTVGAATFEAISQVHADVFFMGVTGIHPDAGLTTGDWEEARIKRAISEASGETIVLVTAEKLNAASPYVIGPVILASGLVVEREIFQAAEAAYRPLGLTITPA
jgi:DeoR/GlpR family transcriptional regulator of sugar metabolism